jgi:hypothetical protein
MRMSSTFLVFDSQSNFRSSSTRFQFMNCYSQSRLNQRRYQIFLFGDDAARLSIATRYGASKSYSPNRNLITTIESSCDGSLSGLRFRARFEPRRHFGGFLLPLNPIWESSTRLTQPHRWGRLLFQYHKNLSNYLLVRNLVASSFRVSLSKVVCR